MSTMLTGSKITYLTARRDAKIAMLEAAETTLDELLARRVEDSSINTGEGSHRTKLRSLKQLHKIIAILEAEIDSLGRKIANFGFLTNMNVRRKW